MPIAQEDDRVLLLSPRGKRFFLRLVRGDRFHTHRGIIEHDALIGASFGSAISSHMGETFYLLKPTIHDELMSLKRASQIIYPKEIGMILLKLGIRAGDRIIDAGTGSGALTMAFAHALFPHGRVYTYDVRKDMLNVARHNLSRVGLADMVEFIHRDIELGFLHQEADALFLDVREPWLYLDQAMAALADGGRLGILVPTTNQIVALLEAVSNYPLVSIEVMETFLRAYKPVPGRLRPKDTMVGHTGYLIFALKVAGPEGPERQ